MNRLLTPRWLALHLLVLLIAAACVSLGLWQLQRLEQRLARNTVIDARLAAPPEPYEVLREALGTTPPEELAYRRVTVRGRYRPEDEILLRGRSYQGQPGWHVLTPLLLEDGRALLVDRGWVPFELDTPPVAEAAPPPGLLTVSGRLQPEQDPPTGPLAGLAPRDPPEGALRVSYYVDVERLQPQFGYPLEPFYLELVTQAPPQPGELPVPPEPPELTRGPHLSYALQWFAFALIALVGYAILLRRALREQGTNADGEKGEARA